MMCTCVHTCTSHKLRNSVINRLHELKQVIEREGDRQTDDNSIFDTLAQRERERERYADIII